MLVLAKKSISTIAIRVVGAVLVFVLQVYLARKLGTYEYGMYSFIISVIVLLAGIGTLGFDSSITRFLIEYKKNNEWHLFNGVVNFSLFAGSIFGFFVIGVVILVVKYMSISSAYNAIVCGLPLVVILIVSNIRQAILKTLRHYARAQVSETVIRPILFIIMIYVVSTVFNDIGACVALILLTCASIVTYFLSSWFVRQALPGKTKSRSAEYRPLCWLGVSLPMLTVTLSSYIISQTDMMMLGMLKNVEYSGFYVAASKLSEISVFWMFAINFVLSPILSDRFFENNIEEMGRYARHGARLSFISAFITFLILWLVGREALSVFGAGFDYGYSALMILMIGHLFNSSIGPVGVVLSLTGGQVFAAKTMMFFAFLNVVMNYLLIPRYGLSGAALSTTATTIFWNITMLLKVRRELAINPTVYSMI